MDNFNRELLALAYGTVKKRRREKMSITNVKRQMWRHWGNYRDGTIAMWAAQIHERVPHTRLESRAEIVADELTRINQFWEWPDEEDKAEWVAWGLAALRWMWREYHGRASIPNATDEEIRDWIAEREIIQMPLWSFAEADK